MGADQRLDAARRPVAEERPRRRALRGTLLVAALAALGASCAVRAQHTAPPLPQPDALGNASGERAPNPVFQEQMEHRRNDERQKELVADTDKLLQLAEQLHTEVAKSDKDQLSVSVVKTSGEIEKLAKSVKEKMRGY